MKLFGRTYRVTLGETVVEGTDAVEGGLAMQFRVSRNLKATPNTAEIKIWNLAPDTRKSIEQPKAVPLTLEVGYGNENITIFKGEMHSAESVRAGADIVTTISTGDGTTAIAQTRVSLQVPAKATPAQILELAVQGLGIGQGNAKQVAASASFGAARVWHGSASKIMNEVARANGLEWSIQNGVLQLLRIGASLPVQAVVLSSDTGLVGSPTVDNKGILSCKCLIQPELEPGMPIVIDGEFVQGKFRVEENEYAGDTDGEGWFCSIKARKWS